MSKLPLYLTLSRIVLVLPILLLAQYNLPLQNWIAVILFIIASITDYYDGYYARKLGAVTNLGKFLDPVADKILVSSLLVLLVHQGKVDIWMAIIFIARDTAISGIRAAAAADNVIIAAKTTGKWKAALQMCSIPMLIFSPGDLGAWELMSLPISIQQIGYFLLWFSVGLSLISGWEYIQLYRKPETKV